MAGETFDFAIVGSSLPAMFLAGLLAQRHGKRVMLVGRPVSELRLPRSLDLLFMPTTSPATWEMLAQAASETPWEVEELGAAKAYGHADLAIHADRAGTRAVFDHIAHIAAANGVRVARGADGWLFRGLPRLDGAVFRPLLRHWIASHGVMTADFDTHPMLVNESGALEVGEIPADQVVLGDDEALLHLPENLWPTSLVARSRIVTLLSPVNPAGAEIQYWPDRGVTSLRQPNNQALGFVDGSAEADDRLASTLSAAARRQALGQSRRVVSRDSAPIVGRLRDAGVFIAAGLGEAAAFFAPALARYLGGVAREDEREWFAAHDPTRVADLAEGK